MFGKYISLLNYPQIESMTNLQVAIYDKYP